MLLKISEFTRREVDFFIKECNFTNDEQVFFNYRNKGYTIEKIAELMYISLPTANRLSRRVKKKILKVL